MRSLIAATDPTVRDTILTAVRSFPEIDCDAVDPETARMHLRRRRYDFAVVVLESSAERSRGPNPIGIPAEESTTLIEELRTIAPSLPVLGVARRTALSVRRPELKRLGLFSLIGAPLDTLELYRTLRRLLDRAKEEAGSPRAAVRPSPRA